MVKEVISDSYEMKNTTSETNIKWVATFNFECFVIFFITVAIIVLNTKILLITWRTNALNQINKYFLTSLTLADLLLGITVTPFSFLVAIFNRWLYGADFCYVEAYLSAISFLVSIYSLMWISIDHYLAIRKPIRYDQLMSPMRCKCWVILIWVTAVCFCTAPMLSTHRDIQEVFFEHAYVCMISWRLQKAYFTTAGVILTGPPLVTLAYTNLYIFTKAYKSAENDFKKCIPVGPEKRPQNYFLSFIVSLVFCFSWLPWSIVQILDYVYSSDALNVPQLHFYVIWLTFGNAFWRVPIYMIFSDEFKTGFRIIKRNIRYKLTCREIPEDDEMQTEIVQV